MKNKITLIALLIAVALPGFTLAEEDHSSSTDHEATSSGKLVPIRKEFRDNRQDILEASKGAKKKILEERKALGASSTLEQKKNFREAIKENNEKRVEALKENREKMKTDIEARKKELESQRKAKKDEKKLKLDQKAKERVQKTIENIFTRLNERLNKLSSVDAKIATKLSALSAAGKDTSSTTPLYTKAQTALLKAKTDVGAAKAASLDQIATTTSKEAFRSFVKTAEDSIKAAGKAYQDVLRAIHRLEEDDDNDDDDSVATSTATSTASSTGSN